MQLTGPPKLNDWVAPYPSRQTPLDAAFIRDRDLETWRKNRNGLLERVGNRHLRGRFLVEWRGLTYNQALRILSELQKPEIRFTPRTDAGDAGPRDFDNDGISDAVLEEATMRVRVVSDLPSATALHRRFVGGQQEARLSVELGTVQTYQTIPGQGPPPSILISTTVDNPTETLDAELNTLGGRLLAGIEGGITDRVSTGDEIIDSPQPISVNLDFNDDYETRLIGTAFTAPSSGRVQEWADKEGDLDASASDVSLRPEWRVAEESVIFDGNRVLDAGGPFFSGDTDFAVFAVVDGSAGNFCGQVKNFPPSRWVLSAGTQWRAFIGDDDIFSNTSLYIDNLGSTILLFHYQSGELRLESTHGNVDTVTQNGRSWPSVEAAIGDGRDDGGGSYSYDGIIQRLLIYEGEVNSTQKKAIFQKLYDIYGYGSDPGVTPAQDFETAATAPLEHHYSAQGLEADLGGSLDLRDTQEGSLLLLGGDTDVTDLDLDDRGITDLWIQDSLYVEATDLQNADLEVIKSSSANTTWPADDLESQKNLFTLDVDDGDVDGAILTLSDSVRQVFTSGTDYTGDYGERMHPAGGDQYILDTTSGTHGWSVLNDGIGPAWRRVGTGSRLVSGRSITDEEAFQLILDLWLSKYGHTTSELTLTGSSALNADISGDNVGPAVSITQDNAAQLALLTGDDAIAVTGESITSLRQPITARGTTFNGAPTAIVNANLRDLSHDITHDGVTTTVRMNHIPSGIGESSNSGDPYVETGDTPPSMLQDPPLQFEDSIPRQTLLFYDTRDDSTYRTTALAVGDSEVTVNSTVDDVLADAESNGNLDQIEVRLGIVGAVETLTA